MRFILVLSLAVAFAYAEDHTQKCPHNQVWSDCLPAANCRQTCQHSVADMMCPAICLSGCGCPDGHLLDEHSQQCVSSCPQEEHPHGLGADCGSRGPCPAAPLCGSDEDLETTVVATGVAPSCCNEYQCTKKTCAGLMCSMAMPACDDDEELQITAATMVYPSCCPTYSCQAKPAPTCAGFMCMMAMPACGENEDLHTTAATMVYPSCCPTYSCALKSCSSMACMSTVPTCASDEVLDETAATNVYPSCCQTFTCVKRSPSSLACGTAHCQVVRIDFSVDVTYQLEDMCSELRSQSGLTNIVVCNMATKRTMYVGIGSEFSSESVSVSTVTIQQLVVSGTLQQRSPMFLSANSATTTDSIPSNSNTGAIVGSVIGAAALVALVALVVIIRRRNAHKHGFVPLAEPLQMELYQDASEPLYPEGEQNLDFEVDMVYEALMKDQQ